MRIDVRTSNSCHQTHDRKYSHKTDTHADLDSRPGGAPEDSLNVRHQDLILHLESRKNMGLPARFVEYLQNALYYNYESFTHFVSHRMLTQYPIKKIQFCGSVLR